MPADKPLPHRTQRLFLALWPDDAAQRQLAGHARQWSWPAECAQYLPQDWHVTLHFIGGVDVALAQTIATSAAVPFHPFTLVLDQPTLWPHGLAVLCASKLPAHLWTLFDRLGQALRGLGLSTETRLYRPHATLARRAHEAIAPAKSDPVVWQVNSYALVVSTGDKDHRYQVIRHYTSGFTL